MQFFFIKFFFKYSLSSHHRFRECVLTETRRACDTKLKVNSKMVASAFSRQILDKALSFLKEQCSNYALVLFNTWLTFVELFRKKLWKCSQNFRPSHGECPGFAPPSFREEENVIKPITNTVKIQSTPAQVDTRYLTSDQVFSENFQPTVENPGSVNPISWIPSSRDERRKTTKPAEFDFSTERKTTVSIDDTSSRSSYGRGMSMSPTESSTKDDIFKATHYKPTTAFWYPGNNINFYNSEKETNDFHSNQVDEPNQQGLARLDAETEMDSHSGSKSIALAMPCLYLFLLSLFRRPWFIFGYLFTRFSSQFTNWN